MGMCPGSTTFFLGEPREFSPSFLSVLFPHNTASKGCCKHLVDLLKSSTLHDWEHIADLVLWVGGNPPFLWLIFLFSFGTSLFEGCVHLGCSLC